MKFFLQNRHLLVRPRFQHGTPDRAGRAIGPRKPSPSDRGAGRRQRRAAGRARRTRTGRAGSDRPDPELADANAELRAGLAAREQAAQVLTERTRDLETVQARLSVTAEFVSALNQEGMLDVYRGALGCLARATEVPLAVIYGASNGDGRSLSAPSAPTISP